MFATILARLLRQDDLDGGEARALMTAIMAGELTESQIAAALTALRIKGETVAEIAGFAAAMRAAVVPVNCRRTGLVDTCGTGGDGLGTFNISTATALVAAAMGIPVAKHGNRAVSSRCGSADVLEALGVNVDLAPEAVATLVDELGIGFLFAPHHHPAMRHAAPVRRQLGVRTVFNVLGPLTNPAGVKRQLLGVFRPELTETLARVLGELGCERAFVVHGMDGSDELSLCGETRISELNDGAVTTTTRRPEDFGLTQVGPADLQGGDPPVNAAIVAGVLADEDGPARDAVLLNAGFVAVLAGRAADPAGGIALARAALAEGRGREVLAALRARSHELARRAAS
jgi:anthranilate phosphoribosyltransferase